MSAITSRKLAEWIYHNADRAIYEENGTHHISCTYFMDNRIMEETANSLYSIVNKIDIASLVCVDQGWDHGIQFMTTWLAMKLEKTFSVIIEGELEAPNLEIRSNLSNCSMMLAYTSHKQQIIDLVNAVKRLGGTPVQIISIIDERGEAGGVCKVNRINFHKIFSMSDIITSLEKLPNTDAIKTRQITELLNR